MDNANLMRNVQEAGFTLTEAALYLDTYCNCSEALEYFYETRERYDAAVREYEESCGPLTQNANTGDRWNWISTPWPWEMGAN